MNITLNNRPEEIEKQEVTLEELLSIKGFSFKLLVTKINGKLVRKEDRAQAIITDGDVVQVHHMVSGG